MQTPLHIGFHGTPASPALEVDIQRRVDDLETLFDRIISCRVLVDAPPPNHRHGRSFGVRIELAIPGHHLVANHGSNDASDVHVAVRDAFAAMTRQLEDHLQRRRDDVKSHVPFTG